MHLGHTGTELPSRSHGGPGAFEKAYGPKEGSEKTVAVRGPQAQHKALAC